MTGYEFYNASMEKLVSWDLGDLEYPYNEEFKMYLKNVGSQAYVSLYVAPSLSIYNFTANCISDAFIIDYFIPFKIQYFELLFKDDMIVSDIYNFKNRNINVEISEDGYCRNVIPNIAIKFNNTNKNNSARILVSDFKNFAGIAGDINNSPATFKRKIDCGIMDSGDLFPFWVKFELLEDMLSSYNPRLFNILVKGMEIRDVTDL